MFLLALSWASLGQSRDRMGYSMTTVHAISLSVFIVAQTFVGTSGFFRTGLAFKLALLSLVSIEVRLGVQHSISLGFSWNSWGLLLAHLGPC